MARIFTILFEHEGTIVNGVISVRETPFFTEYVVNIPEEELLRQLPSNRMYLAENGRLAFMHQGSQPPTPLMHQICDAVQEHLHLVQR